MKLRSQMCILLPSSLSRRYCLSGSWKTDFCTDILEDSIIPYILVKLNLQQTVSIYETIASYYRLYTYRAHIIYIVPIVLYTFEISHKDFHYTGILKICFH